MRKLQWVYQERESDTPWALYMEREWLYRKPRDAIYTLRLYSERVPDSCYFLELKQAYLTKEKALKWIAHNLVDIYGEAHADDLDQLISELEKFF